MITSDELSKKELEKNFQLVQGQYDALVFLHLNAELADAISLEIANVEKSLLNISTAINKTSIESLNVPYRKSYLTTLKEGNRNLKDFSENKSGEKRFPPAYFYSVEGRKDALSFVLQNFDTPSFLQDEIKRMETFIANPPSVLKNANTTTTSPGIYKRSYLETLKEALEILK
jgi:hypothetical protein